MRLVGRRRVAPVALTYVGLAVGIAVTMPLEASLSGTDVPSAQDVLALWPARVVAIAANSLGTLAVVVVALPFLRHPAEADDRLVVPSKDEERRLMLVEQRDRALAALKELEFDHRTGKISDVDYRAQVGPLRRRAADVLRALERGEGARHERVPDHGERVP